MTGWRESRRLDTARLCDWLEGRLQPAEAHAVESAVTGDRHLGETVAWLRRFLEFSRHTVLDTAPAETRQALTARFEAWARQRRRVGVVQRLAAVLTFDSRTQSATAGIRSGLAEATHLVFTTQPLALALDVHALGEQVEVAGQVLPCAPEADGIFHIWLTTGGLQAAATTSDDLGEFSLPAVTPGSYELHAEGTQVYVVIASLRLDL